MRKALFGTSVVVAVSLVLAGWARVVGQINPVPADAITTKPYANLGSPPNGVIYYCSDCAAATTCAAGGTGAYAFRTAGAWNCAAITDGCLTTGCTMTGGITFEENGDGDTFITNESGATTILAVRSGPTTYRGFRAASFAVRGTTQTYVYADSNALALAYAQPIQWSDSSTDATSTKQAGLYVNSPNAGVIRVTDGTTTGRGLLTFGEYTVANTSTALPEGHLSNVRYTNTGDGDGSQVTLPNDPAIGTCFQGAVLVAQNFDFVPSAGESIRDGASTGSTRIRSNTIGDVIKLCSVTGGSGAVWLVISKAGTWALS